MDNKANCGSRIPGIKLLNYLSGKIHTENQPEHSGPHLRVAYCP